MIEDYDIINNAAINSNINQPKIQTVNHQLIFDKNWQVKKQIMLDTYVIDETALKS